MPESPLAKAQLIELKDDFSDVKPGGKTVVVQFNPETLKVSFANQVAQSNGANPTTGPAGRQFVGEGTTKLALQLWFDVTAPAAGQKQAEDVRELTGDVIYFITTHKDDQTGNRLPPAVRFEWGSFRFDGAVDSMEESLEFFSREGRPLRASMSLNLSQQRIEVLKGESALPPGAGGSAPGTQPLTAAPAGATLQGLAAAAGGGASWQAIATANGIENPRLLAPGQLINLNVSASIGA
jgi:hypothetical protein